MTEEYPHNIYIASPCCQMQGWAPLGVNNVSGSLIGQKELNNLPETHEGKNGTLLRSHGIKEQKEMTAIKIIRKF